MTPIRGHIPPTTPIGVDSDQIRPYITVGVRLPFLFERDISSSLMGVYYPGYARFKRGLREHRARRRAFPSFWSLFSACLRVLRVVMGVRLYARNDEEESESFSRSKFTGDPLDYSEWAFKHREPN